MGNNRENMFIQSWICQDRSVAKFSIPESATEKDLEDLRMFANIVINYKLKSLVGEIKEEK